MDPSEASPEPASRPEPVSHSCWTPTRTELREWLRRNAPSLAELYEGALKMVFEDPIPGRVRFVSHAVREIRNRLPDAISGPKASQRLDYPSRMDRIAEVWQRRAPNLESVAAAGGNVSTPDPTIPRELLASIAELVKDHQETRRRPEEAAVRLFEGVAPENEEFRDALRPTVLQWLGVTEWFVGKAHDSGLHDAGIDPQEFRSQFERFELILGALVRGFYTTQRELNEILEAANS